jgi:hypothetical protein
MRCVLPILIAVFCAGCGASKTSPRITQFYAKDKKIPRGVKGNLCYGVEHASKVELSPAVEVLWPAPARCFEISPQHNTTYTVTAYGEDGSKDAKSVNIEVGPAPPRIYDLSASSALIRRGEKVVVCFKVADATSVKAEPGRFDKRVNCITDNPKKTTTYKITALGDGNQMDSGTVTVQVR